MPEKKATQKKLKVIIAGGGTGGHLYPGIALAESFKKIGAEVHFVGSKRGIETRVVPREGYDLHLIPVKGLKGGRIIGTILGFLVLPLAFFKSIWILLRVRPQIVVGVGGYASGPLVMTATMLFFRTFILEQNTRPGITNRILGKFVRRIYASFKESAGFFPANRFVSAGNPVRENIVESIKNAGQSEEHADCNILVFGGSQGAHAINKALIDAASKLSELNIKIRHQTGKLDQSEVKAAYEKAGIKSEVSEFIYEMHDAYNESDVIICRAGATTLAELAIAGKPAILIPYPYAADNHQELNALAVESAGGAICITERDLSIQVLIDTLKKLTSDSVLRGEMSNKMKALAKPQAASDIRDDMLKFLKNYAEYTTLSGNGVKK